MILSWLQQIAGTAKTLTGRYCKKLKFVQNYCCQVLQLEPWSCQDSDPQGKAMMTNPCPDIEVDPGPEAPKKIKEPRAREEMASEGVTPEASIGSAEEPSQCSEFKKPDSSKSWSAFLCC